MIQHSNLSRNLKAISMAISLQDQLLKAGLIKKDKANQVKKEKYKQSKQQRNSKTAQIDEATLLAQKSLTEKQAKDRELNQQQKIKADKKALMIMLYTVVPIYWKCVILHRKMPKKTKPLSMISIILP